MKIKDVRHGLFHPHVYSGSFPQVFFISFLPQLPLMHLARCIAKTPRARTVWLHSETMTDT